MICWLINCFFWLLIHHPFATWFWGMSILGFIKAFWWDDAIK